MGGGPFEGIIIFTIIIIIIIIIVVIQIIIQITIIRIDLSFLA